MNPNLDRGQQAVLQELLEEYGDIFAINPKSPKTTHLALHVINTSDQLPIKAKNIQLKNIRSPQTDARSTYK